MTELLSYKQMWWGSRRGMKELDLLLIPFIEKHYETMTDDEKLLYQTMLNRADTELYAWFFTNPEDIPDELESIITMIKPNI